MGKEVEREKYNKLKKELKAKTEKCREYEEKMAHISVLDRWKIGEYLHDSLAQKLNYTKILMNLLKQKINEENTELIDQCNEILNMIDQGINEVRDLSHDIIPVDIGKEGIIDAFNYLKKQVETRHDINCELETGRIIEKDIHKNVISNLYLIAQEAIKNAIAHGLAKKVKIALFEHEGQLYMHVKDDGKGFEPTGKGGVGLVIMKYRAEEMGGTFRIRKAKEADDYSTYVTCNIPLKSLTDEDQTE